MIIANLPACERARLIALRSLDLLDTPAESIFDEITKLAAQICETPISLLSLIDENRQWIKSQVGLEFQQTPRDFSFCSHTILQDEPLVVADATKDPRFFNNPYVQSFPHMVFYAGVPLRTPEGHNLGALCVLDHQPRLLTSAQVESLKALSRQTMEFILLQTKVKKISCVGKKVATENAATKRISRLLKEERSRMLAYLDKAPVGISVLRGPEFTYEVVNEEYRKITGLSQEFVGRKYFDVFPQLRGTEVEAMLQSVYLHQKPISASDYRFDKINEKGEVESFFYDFQLQPFANPQGPMGILSIVLDTTKKNQALQQIMKAKNLADEANLAKSRFLANMSHEIRTPLGAIMGFADQLAQPNLAPELFQEYLTVINRNSSHLQRIIDDILDLSKVEAGKMMLENIVCCLEDVVQEFSSLMIHRAQENGVQFSVFISPQIPKFIVSDPVRIKQILTNMVGNAIKFSPNGRVDLVISSSSKMLEFKVKDTGVGISKEQAKKIFQAFTQADTSTTRKFGGTGLGLVLTRKICETMGGRFFLESSLPHLGSTFVAQIKFEKAQTRSGSNFEKPPPPTPSDVEALKEVQILLVDDSKDNQLLIRILLEKAGARVTLASDGYEGVLKALSFNFDLILMDVQMPQLDGMEATRELRSKGYRKTIIALTAHAMAEEREACYKAGYDDFLTKPVQKDLMISVLKSHIQKRRNNKGPLRIEI